MSLIKINRRSTRRGRGIAAGQGKTAGRGTKGQNARAGSRRYLGFGSGSLPYAQRLPKLAGNRPVNPYITVTTAQIERTIASAKDEQSPLITIQWLKERRLIPSRRFGSAKVKIVVRGRQSRPYTLGSLVKASKGVQLTTTTK